MSAKRPGIAGMNAVTISRRYGAGGGEIAARLARRLGWQVVDREFIAQIASRLEISTNEAEEEDERGEGFVTRMLSAMRLAVPTDFALAMPVPAEDAATAYREAVRAVVAMAVRTGHVIIVGRGAQVLLADRPDVLHVRLVAPLASRVPVVASREGLSEAAARALIERKDRDRTRYIQAEFHRDVNDPLLYDLIINTAAGDYDGATDLIVLALERKAERLSMPQAEQGPGAGPAGRVDR